MSGHHQKRAAAGAISLVPLSVDDSYFVASLTAATSYSFTSDISPDEGDHVLILISTQNSSNNAAVSGVTVGGNAVDTVVAEFTIGDHRMSAYLYEVPEGGHVNPAIAFSTSNNGERVTVSAYDVSGTMQIGYKDHGSEEAAAADNSFDIDVDEGGIAIGLYSYWASTSNRTFTGLTNDEHGTASNVQYGDGHIDDLSNDDTYTVSCNNDNGQDNSILFAVSFI